MYMCVCICTYIYICMFVCACAWVCMYMFINKVPIIHIFHFFKIHQRQTPSLYFILAVCHFLN